MRTVGSAAIMLIPPRRLSIAPSISTSGKLGQSGRSMSVVLTLAGHVIPSIAMLPSTIGRQRGANQRSSFAALSSSVAAPSPLRPCNLIATRISRIGNLIGLSARRNGVVRTLEELASSTIATKIGTPGSISGATLRKRIAVHRQAAGAPPPQWLYFMIAKQILRIGRPNGTMLRSRGVASRRGKVAASLIAIVTMAIGKRHGPRKKSHGAVSIQAKGVRAPPRSCCSIARWTMSIGSRAGLARRRPFVVGRLATHVGPSIAMPAMTNGRKVGVQRRKSGVVTTQVRAASRKAGTCPLIAMMPSTSGRRHGPSRRRDGVVTRQAEHVLLSIATSSLPSGIRHGLKPKRIGVVPMSSAVAPRPLRREPSIATQVLSVGRKAGRTRRSSGVAKLLVVPVIRMTATLTSNIGRRSGPTRRRHGVANTKREDAQQQPTQCSIAMRNLTIMRWHGVQNRRRGAAT